MSVLESARREPGLRAAELRAAVLLRLDPVRPTTRDALLGSLRRDHGTTAWHVGIDSLLRAMADEGLVTVVAAATYLRARPRVEDWLGSLPAELRSELSTHDIAALRQEIGG